VTGLLAMNADHDIDTASLILRRASIGSLSALITGPCEYERVFGHNVEDGYIEYPDMLVFSLQQAQAFAGEMHWWLPYLIIHRTDAILVGACGFKGPPDDDGVVEIGYGIAPAYRGRGLTTEAAAALSDLAFSRTGVTGVRAHTYPEPNASTRILTKCGFIRTGEFDDPDDGILWEWHLTGI
jgi:RimJ/RimL family protein N-acetyltransferase